MLIIILLSIMTAKSIITKMDTAITVSRIRSSAIAADWFSQQEHAEEDTDAQALVFIVLLLLFIKHLNILVSPFV